MWKFLTQDISSGGLFIRTDDPKGNRKLLDLRLQLLPSGEWLETRAVVVHSLARARADERGTAPGMGLQFFSFDGDKRKLWDGYVDLLVKKYHSGTIDVRPVSPHVDAVRRKHPRRLGHLHLTVTNVAPLLRVITKDLSLGGVFVFSDDLPTIGKSVFLEAEDPKTLSGVTLSGRVVRTVDKGPGKGFGVQFVDTPIDQRERLMCFVPLVTLTSDEVTVDDDDRPPFS